jgi:crotonobetainyl-CoA:carnitine CoA-transferase CaiB-like acyl-CoA transferase
MTDTLPLAGIRVLDVSSFIAAPAAAVALGDYGADVVKVEPPGEGDPHRTNINIASFPKSQVNYPWHLDARNKRSIALDLKNPEGRAVLDRLIAGADVLITNYPFPVRKRLRLEHADVRAVNERIIYASFTGYGEEGPDKDQVGFDSTAYFARSGLLDNLRYEGHPPAFSLPAQGDRASAMAFFGAIVLALFERERSGKGRMVSTSLYANGLWSNGVYAQAALLGAFIANRPPRERPRSAIANMYRTADDRWVSIAVVSEDKMWPSFCRSVGRPDLERDPRFAETATRRANAAALTAILDPIFATRTWEDWHATLHEGGIPHSVIGRSQDLAGDAQAVAAKAVVETANPEMPRTLATPFQIEGLRPRPAGPAPALGEHTDLILAEAGLDASEIARLRAAGAVA